jgi:hypothetical protein
MRWLIILMVAAFATSGCNREEGHGFRFRRAATRSRRHAWTRPTLSAAQQKSA